MAHGPLPSVERLLSESVWLMSLARALLGSDEHEAEDVVQEVRLAALTSAPSDPGHARAWLVRVTRNLAMRAHLRRTRRERRERAAAFDEAQPSTLDLVARVNAQRKVAAAVVALDEPYRSVVLLRYFDALAMPDVAERLGVPVETARTRLKRAMVKLREKLDAEFGGRETWAALLLPWAPAKSAAVAGTGAAAVVVGVGVVTMSVLTKSAIAVACVVAAAVTWRLLPGSAGSESASAGRHGANGTELVAARGADENGSDLSRRSESADATRSTDATPATDATAPASPAPNTVRVTATVVSSLDDRPVAGAELRITTMSFEQSTRTERLLASVRSDAEGRVAATVSVEAQLHPNWEVLAEGFVPGGGWNFDASPAARGRCDLGTIRLARGTRVSGRVVRAPDLQPVAGAELRFDRFAGDALERLDIVHPIATSAADGSFMLQDRISVSSRDFAPLFALNDEGIGIGIVRVPPAAEEVAAVDVVFGVPARLTVSIRDDAGAPIGGARVCCMPRFLPFTSSQMRDGLQEFLWLSDPRLLSIFCATSDSTGVATFTKLPMAPTMPVLDPRDAGATRYAVAAQVADHEYCKVTEVRVDSAAPTACTVVLPRTRFVSVVGKVIALDGEPIPDAAVDAWAYPSHFLATTDEKGEFQVDRLPTSMKNFQLKVTAAGRTKFEHGFEFTSLATVPLLDEHGASIEARSIDVVLERTARVSGRVVDETGAPIADARVSYQPSRNGVFMLGAVDVETPGTDEQGRFDHEVTESEWSVLAWAPLGGGTYGPSTTCVVKGGAHDLVLTCPTRARRAAKATCEVVDATSGAPVPVESAYVEPAEGFRGDWNVWKSITLGQVVVSSLFAGRWRIDLVLVDHRRASQEFEIANDHDEVRLRVEVGSLARVVGRIELSPADAAALPRSARLDWHPSDVVRRVDAEGRILSSSLPAYADLGDDRRFILDGFVPGQTARVRFTDFDRVFDEVVFTPTRGEVREIVLRPGPAAHVVWTSGADVSKGNLNIDLAMGDEPWRSEFWLARRESGRNEPAHTIRPGHYRWRAFFQPDSTGDEPPHVTTASGEFVVAAGATHELRIDELR